MQPFALGFFWPYFVEGWGSAAGKGNATCQPPFGGKTPCGCGVCGVLFAVSFGGLRASALLREASASNQSDQLALTEAIRCLVELGLKAKTKSEWLQGSPLTQITKSATHRRC